MALWCVARVGRRRMETRLRTGHISSNVKQRQKHKLMFKRNSHTQIWVAGLRATPRCNRHRPPRWIDCLLPWTTTTTKTKMSSKRKTCRRRGQRSEEYDGPATAAHQSRLADANAAAMRDRSRRQRAVRTEMSRGQCEWKRRQLEGRDCVPNASRQSGKTP